MLVSRQDGGEYVDCEKKHGDLESYGEHFHCSDSPVGQFVKVEFIKPYEEVMTLCEVTVKGQPCSGWSECSGIKMSPQFRNAMSL